MSRMPKEKSYRITKAMGGDGIPITETIRESDLNDKQIEHIYGDLLRNFNNAPRKVQIKFINRISRQITDMQNKKKMRDLTIKMKEHGEKLKREESHKDSTEQEKKA